MWPDVLFRSFPLFWSGLLTQCVCLCLIKAPPGGSVPAAVLHFPGNHVESFSKKLEWREEKHFRDCVPSDGERAGVFPAASLFLLIRGGACLEVPLCFQSACRESPSICKLHFSIKSYKIWIASHLLVRKWDWLRKRHACWSVFRERQQHVSAKLHVSASAYLLYCLLNLY